MFPRYARRTPLVFASVLTIFIATFWPGTAQAETNGLNLPPTERSIFVLDLSGSTNGKGLWEFGLRPSIINKLSSAFGYPVRKGIARPLAPSDITVTIINSNSRLAPLVKIVEVEDALKIWGLIINKIGKNPTSARLDAIVVDFFGEGGAYTELAGRYLISESPAAISASTCQKDAEAALARGAFMDDVERSLRVDSAKVLCEVVLKIASAMKSADSYFANYKCANSSCSDVVGAVLRTTALAQDAFRKNRNAKICLALASDMLNNFPGISTRSPLNTLRVVKTSPTLADAEKRGSEAAQAASVKFPLGMKVRVSVIGQGSSESKGIPLDRMSYLDAYWRGFWSGAGIKTTAQAASLSEACN